MTAPRLMSNADRRAHANHCLMLAQGYIDACVIRPELSAMNEAKALQHAIDAVELIGSIKKGRQAQ